MSVNNRVPLNDVDGLIFDLDGTLVDSALDFAAIRNELDCPPGLGVLEFIDQLPNADTRRWAHRVVLRHEIAGAERATLIPGADTLLSALAERNIPTAILTRNASQVAALTLERLNLDVKLVLAREDCAPKPDPEGLQRIANTWSISTQRLIYVGDFIYDLQAANRAGMRGCLYDPDGNSPYRGHADIVVSSLLALLPEH